MKKIAVLPSLLTLGNAFCGFLAVAKVGDAALAYRAGEEALFTGNLQTAVLLIFLAMVFDALDGKVARLTNQTTDFGAQLDSLSDAVTFGVAPAFLGKVLLETEGIKVMPFLAKHPRFIFLITAVYALFAVMRLARFNVESQGHEEEFQGRFKGLPTPAAGGFIAALVLFWINRTDSTNVVLSNLPDWVFDTALGILPWGLLAAGAAMVSPVPYAHLVNFLFKRRKSFPFLAGLVSAIGFVAISYEAALFFFTLVYLVSGPVLGGIDHLRKGAGRGGGGRLLEGPRSASG